MSGASSAPAVPSPPHGSRAVESSTSGTIAHSVRALLTEPNDIPGRIALSTAMVTLAYTVGQPILLPHLATLPFALVRLALYGTTLLGGLLLAAGFLSSNRKARIAAGVTTAAVASSFFALRLGWSGSVLLGVRWAYIGALVGIGALWLGGILRRRAPQ